jgi:formylglycine-generating enzyme required for sulfatase activity
MENSASAREETGSAGMRKLSPASLVPAVAPTGPIRNRWALLVGVNHFVDPVIPDLRFCVNDVVALEQVLQARSYTTVALHDAVTEEHLQPNRDNVEAELARLCRAAGPDDLLWVHLACHGKLVNGEPVLITRETREPTLAEKALPLSQIERRMRGSEARRLVLTIDACHAGVDMDRGSPDPQFLRNVYELAEGFALLAASTAQGVAQESAREGHGLFTYYLLDGLSGEADRDQKGFVTVDDLRKHVVDGLRRWYGEQRGQIQEPTARIGAVGDMILAKVTTARLPFEPELVTVPAGPFLMGTSHEQIVEMVARFEWAEEWKEGAFFDIEPQHEVDLPAFEIGRYPVTNGEYAAFLKATFREPHDDQEPASHPVVGVSWPDAQNYVSWLRGETGRPYRLPTEAEWEKAARGTEGRLWPWGDEWDPGLCNSGEAGPGGTTQVGQYSPGGDSPYGCADMAGNVSEWCQSRFKPYPYDPQDGREDLEASGHRVMRGGSFLDDAMYVRCACRNWLGPDLVNWSYGFRVVAPPR